MKFAMPLLRGRLIRRYKRFLVDVRLDSGETVTATCPNTGSMIGLNEPGASVWLSVSDSPTRKYPHTWELVEARVGKRRTIVGINTGHPNRLVSEAITNGKIGELAGYGTLRREVKYGQNSRIDVLLQSPDRPDCYVEIKNVHLLRKARLAEFPDSVTERGIKHLVELSNMVRAGHRAVMLYLIQRADAEALGMARDIDPRYGQALDNARAVGVEALAYGCHVDPSAIEIRRSVPLTD